MKKNGYKKHYFHKWKKLKGEYWAFESLVICYCDHEPLGDYSALDKWAKKKFALSNYRPSTFYKMVAYDEYRDTLMRRNVRILR